MIANLVMIIAVLATATMVGIIWLVQVLVYPAFLHVKEAFFAEYHQHHMKSITRLVAPLIVLEVVSIAVLFALAFSFLSFLALAINLAVIALTMFWQVPLHRQLSKTKDTRTILKLVRSNWIRTTLWTAKLGVLVALLATA